MSSASSNHIAFSGMSTEESVTEVMIRLIAEAHYKTCCMQASEIQESIRKGFEGHDVAQLVAYRSLSREQVWIECADKLTTVIAGVIEFAKMVPGFMKLCQDDQIILLLHSSFELAVVRMSRLIDLNTGNVVFAKEGRMLSQSAFHTQDAAEKKLIERVFELAKSIAELKLTETQLGLYSALILFSFDGQGLIGVQDVRRVYQLLLRTIKDCQLDMMSVHDENTVFDVLLAKISELREVSRMHMEAVTKFYRSQENIPFSPLYREIFNLNYCSVQDQSNQSNNKLPSSQSAPTSKLSSPSCRSQ